MKTMSIHEANQDQEAIFYEINKIKSLFLSTEESVVNKEKAGEKLF